MRGERRVIYVSDILISYHRKRAFIRKCIFFIFGGLIVICELKKKLPPEAGV